MSHKNTPLDSTHLTRQAQKHTKEDIIFGEDCYKIIDCAVTVWKLLGYGFLEKVHPFK